MLVIWHSEKKSTNNQSSRTIFMILSIVIPGAFAKALKVVLFGTVKFFFSPILAKTYGFNLLQTFLTVAIGGVLGVILFFIVSEWALKGYELIKKKLRLMLGLSITKKKIFTKRNRMIVKIIRSYGLIGLIILTPVLTIPLGTFLAMRYFHHKENVLLYLSFSVVGWAFILSFIAIYL